MIAKGIFIYTSVKCIYQNNDIFNVYFLSVIFLNSLQKLNFAQM